MGYFCCLCLLESFLYQCVFQSLQQYHNVILESPVFILFWITNQFHYTRTFCHVQSSYYSYNAFIPFITNNDMVTRLHLVIKNTRCYKHLIGKILALVWNINSCIVLFYECGSGYIGINQSLLIFTWIYAIIYM